MIRSPPDRRTQGIPTESACRPMPDHDATLSFGSVARSPITIIASGSQISFGVVVHDRGRVSPRHATFFSLLVQAKKAKEHDPTVCVPSLRCGQTCITPFSSRCGKTRFALRAPLKQVAANLCPRCIGTLRCQCPQPEISSAAGADTRVEADTDGLREL